MIRYFRRVEQRAAELGNHRRKYLHGIEREGRRLIDRLEASGRFDRVHLRRRAIDLADEMSCVSQSGRDEKERLALLGCYYALHFLILNIRSIDTLRLSISEATDRISVYERFLRRTGDEYGRLVREYVRHLLRIFLSGRPKPEFVICAVGTRIHQDDVDLGIIDDGTEARRELNRAIGRMATEMIRWASAPDFYLSEHVGAEGYTVSIDEYCSRLDARVLDFVSVTEILAATPLVGSRALFEKFARQIHDRYYAPRHGSNKEHEAYLRGLLGEINSLLWWPQNPHLINPKHDLLRPVTALLWAFRTMYDVRHVGTWKTFRELSRHMRRHRAALGRLEQSYTFVETFRHLYQQFAAQEEEIEVTAPGEQASLQQVAEAMGYQDAGAIRAWQHLLVHYHERVAAGRTCFDELLPEISTHVQRTTVFGPIVRERLRPRPNTPRINVAEAILERRRYFQSIKYWQDLIEVIEQPASPLLAALVEDIQELDEEPRREVVRGFAEWGSETFLTALRLMIAIGERRRELSCEQLFKELNDAFLENLTGSPDEIRRFATVFVHSPAIVHRYLAHIDEEGRGRFHAVLAGRVFGGELTAWRDRLLALSSVHLTGSRYLMRTFERVCREKPEYLMDMAELDRLDQVARGLQAGAMRSLGTPRQMEALGEYYDVEFLRTSLSALRGDRFEEVNEHFSSVCDHYLELLFDSCKALIDRERNHRILTHDRLGVFASGGHGRRRAFQDDWDLVVVLASDSDELFEYSNRIVARMNREITKRGLMVQYHFADRFGALVTKISELEPFLLETPREAFVEMAQILGARMVVGSGRVESLVFERVIERCIFAQAKTFIEMASDEIRSRHAYREDKGGWQNDSDVKECRGGLRDLEMIMLMWKVHDRLRDPIGDSFWSVLMERHPRFEGVFRDFRRANAFLNRLRDIYRLTVAPVNRLRREDLHRPASIMVEDTDGVGSPAEQLQASFLWHRERVAKHIDVMLDVLADGVG